MPVVRLQAPRMTLDEAESLLGLNLPERHRCAMLNLTDPIHEACDFLLLDSQYELLRWVGVNEFLHAANRWNCWPPFLVAFASNGCGDYFAYDTRTSPPQIIYMDPDHTVDENLSEVDGLRFCDFETWYEKKIAGRRTKR